MDEDKKRELIYELQKLIDMKEHDLEEGYLKRYKPHDKQNEFHLNDADIRLFLGGNQSGKSRGGYSEDVAFALGYRPWDGTLTATPPNKVLVVGPDFKNHHAEITIPYLRRMIPRSALLDGSAAYEKDNTGNICKFNFKNGSIIKLMSNEQHNKKARNQVSPFEGHMWDFIHFDEPPPYGVFVACQRGVMARNGRIIMTLTPLGVAWLYDKVYCKAGNINPDGNPDIYAVHVSIHDNPHLPERQKQNFLASLTPEVREAREFGRFLHLVGLVYKGYNPNVHVRRYDKTFIDPNWPKGKVIDPHDRKPCAIAWFAVTPEKDIIFFDEWPNEPFYEMTTSPIRTVEGYANLIREKERGIPGGPESVIYNLMDPNFGQSTKLGNIYASLVDDFARHGVYFNTEIKDDVEEGHLRVAKLLDYDSSQPISALNKPRLFFTDNCINLTYGMSHYLWDDWRQDSSGKAVKEKPQEEFKDFPDLVRYTAIFDPQYFDMQQFRHGSELASRQRRQAMAHSGLG